MTAALVDHAALLQSPHLPNPARGRRNGVVVHAAVVSMIAASVSLQRPILTLCVGGASIFAVYGSLCWREGRRTPLYFGPLSFMFFWNSIGLGLSAIYIATQLSGGKYLQFGGMYLSSRDVVHGYVVYLVGMVAMHAGMELLRPKSPDIRFGADLSFRRPLPILLIGFAIGLAYLVTQPSFSFLGGVAGFMNRLAVAALSIFALLPHWHLGLKRSLHWLLLLLATIALALASIKSGSKAYIMCAFFPVVWAMIARRELRRNLIYVGLGLVVLYTGLIAPVVAESRARFRAEQRTAYRVLWQAAQDSSPLFSGEWELGSYVEQLEAYLARMFDAEVMGFLVQEVELRGFRYGDTMKYAAYAFIPRVLWPEKPNVSRGAWFTTYLGFSPREEEATTSTGITATGELYWNFGLPGVGVGMFVLGLLFGLLWRMAGANPIKSPLHFLLYVQVALGIPNLSEWVTVVASNLCFVILFGATFFLLVRTSQVHTDRFARKRMLGQTATIAPRL